MKKVKMLVSFLLFLLFTSSQVNAECSSKTKDIPMYKVKKHLGTRTTEPSVTASLEQNQLTVNVSRYVGIARVKIYDDSGSFVANISLIVDGTGQSALDLSTFNDGFYEIAVEFDNMIYVGTFEL